MGCCYCKKDKEAYEFHETETLHEKVKAYSDSNINRYNIIRNISFGMKELANKSLDGETKKSILTTTIKEFLDPNSFPVELVEKIIDNFIEDIYLSFKKEFKRRCC
jgi:DNA modification methylase